MSVIIDAINMEDISKVKRILEEKPSLVDEKDEHGVLAALLAAKTGNLNLIRYIVEYSRASMNIIDDNHNTMLHYAAMSGDVESCRYLVEKVGLSPLEGDLNLLTPYEIAHNKGFQSLENYFESVVGAPLSRMYHNPIRTGMFPDPSIVRVGEDYYMVNSSFIYFPCIPVSHSKDLIHWKIIGYAITNPEWANIDHLEGGRGYWAPDISYYEGKFYITATYRMNDDGTVYRKQIVVSSEKPEGPYSKPAIIDEDGIDPSIFNDTDGRRYMLLNRGARILEISKDATKQISEATLLYYGDNKRASEGPHLLKKDDYYYLFQAEGGTGPGHRITVSRSKQLHGNYKPCPYNPIMRQMDENAIIQRCGHGKPVQTQNGQWYMVYLCGRKIGDGYSMLGRETALDPIEWTSDGWPIVNQLNGPSALQIKPDLPENDWESKEYDDFDDDKLSSEWVFPRVPENDGYKLSDSVVRIKSSTYDLSSVNARNILLRRQQHFKFQAVARMCMPELKAGQDAGLVCYYDENTYVKLGVFGCAEDQYATKDAVNTSEMYSDTNIKNTQMVAKVSEHIGDQNKDSSMFMINSSEKNIYLKVETDYLKRTFSISYDGKCYFEIASLNNVYYLCDEGLRKGKRFTGAMIGMYAFAGSECNSDDQKSKEIFYAEFDSFDYQHE